MENKFELVKSYLDHLGYLPQSEDPAEELVVVTFEEEGIYNLIIDCEPPLLVFEQFIGTIENESQEIYKRLLQINRQLVHGAFALDEEKNRLLFRDTLQIENLDENEVQGTLTALSLAMAEFGNELVTMCQ